MVRRFTVIQGGLTAEPVATRSDPAAHAAACAAGGHTADLAVTRPVDARSMRVVETVAAAEPWATPPRNLAGEVNCPSDHPSMLARHRPAGLRAAVALAWSRDAETGREAPGGTVPLQASDPVLGGHAHPWQSAAAVADAAAEGAAASVDRALRVRLAALRRPIGLVGSVEPMRTTAPSRPRLAVNGSARRRAIPTENCLGIRPRGWEPPASVIPRVTEPKPVREAAQIVLIRDVLTAAQPVIPVPSETSRTHAVSGPFGRGGTSCFAVLRRAGAIVSKSLRLGSGGASMPWRRAQS